MKLISSSSSVEKQDNNSSTKKKSKKFIPPLKDKTLLEDFKKKRVGKFIDKSEKFQSKKTKNNVTSKEAKNDTSKNTLANNKLEDSCKEVVKVVNESAKVLKLNLDVLIGEFEKIESVRNMLSTVRCTFILKSKFIKGVDTKEELLERQGEGGDCGNKMDIL
ncbi:hypothetical protein ABK040_013696 [Willaertia magna]